MTKEYSRNLTADETVALRSVRRSGSVNAGVALGIAVAGMSVGLYQQSTYAQEASVSQDTATDSSDTDTGLFGRVTGGIKDGTSGTWNYLSDNIVVNNVTNTVKAGWNKIEPTVTKAGTQIHTVYAEQRDRTPGTTRDSISGVDFDTTKEGVQSFNDLSYTQRMKEDGKSAVRNYSNIVRHVVGGANIKGDYSETKTSVLNDKSGNALRDQSIVASFVEFGVDIYNISQDQVTPGEKADSNESDVSQTSKFKTKVHGDLDAIVQNSKGVFEALTLGHDDADNSKDTPGVVGSVKTFGEHLVDAVKCKTDGTATWKTSTSWRAKLGYVGDKGAAFVNHAGSGIVELPIDAVVASFDVAHDTVAVGLNVVSPILRTTTLAGDKAGNIGDSVIKFAHDSNDVVTNPVSYVQVVDLALDVTEASGLIVEDVVAGSLELAHVPFEATLGWNKFTKPVSNVAKSGLDITKAVASTALDFQAHRAVVTPDLEMLSNGHLSGLPLWNYLRNSGSIVKDDAGNDVRVRDSEFVSSNNHSVLDVEASRSARSYRATLTPTREAVEILSAVWAWKWILNALKNDGHNGVLGLGPNEISGNQFVGNQIKK